MNKYFVIMILVFFLSCKKESPIDPTPITIEPGIYYPIYPGSSWTYYSYSTNGLSTSRTDSVYRLHAYKSKHNDCFQTDSVYVPFLNGNPIYGYTRPQHISSYSSTSPSDCMTLVPFLDEDLGLVFGLTTDEHGGGYEYRVTQLIDTMTVRGQLYSNIIEVQFKQYAWTGSTLHLTKTHYARNVGMIRSAVLFTTYNPVLLDTIELDSYYINH